MFGWFRRKPKFKEEFEEVINTISFTFELFIVDKTYYWGATDKANLFHQYLSPPYEAYEAAQDDLLSFKLYVEEQTYGNY